MHAFRTISASALHLLALAPAAGAGTLELRPLTTFDVSALNIASTGDVAFADSRIWISDAANGGRIYAINSVNGSLLNTIDPGPILGLFGGPDALCTIGATGLCAFSSFGESVGGLFLWTSGSLIANYPSSQGATGADFNAQGLWIASGLAPGVGAVLVQLDGNDGHVLNTVPIPGLNVRIVDICFDPFSGGLYALCEDDQLRQIDITNGAILSSQDLGPLMIGHLVVSGGIDFDSTGSRMFLFNGNGAGAHTIVVLERVFSKNVCGSGIGSFPCPCSNVGLSGRGCRNSFGGNPGALIDTSGLPRLSADSLVIRAQDMPPGSAVLFFQTESLLSPAVAFGDGVLCAGGAIVRLGVKLAPAGSAQYPEAGDPSIHLQGQITTTPVSRVYQGWYRDAADFCTTATFNLTNAVAVEWRP